VRFEFSTPQGITTWETAQCEYLSVLGCGETDIILSEVNKNEGQSDRQNRKESIWKITSHFKYLLQVSNFAYLRNAPSYHWLSETVCLTTVTTGQLNCGPTGDCVTNFVVRGCFFRGKGRQIGYRRWRTVFRNVGKQSVDDATSHSSIPQYSVPLHLIALTRTPHWVLTWHIASQANLKLILQAIRTHRGVNV
jgi:hypothetical protein